MDFIKRDLGVKNNEFGTMYHPGPLKVRILDYISLLDCKAIDMSKDDKNSIYGFTIIDEIDEEHTVSIVKYNGYFSAVNSFDMPSSKKYSNLSRFLSDLRRFRYEIKEICDKNMTKEIDEDEEDY